MNKIKKIISIILNIFSYIIIGFLLLYVGFMLYNKFTNKNKLISIGNYYVFKIGSGSMEPTIHVHDYIVIKKQKDYNKDDVVTFNEDGYYVTHRIIKTNGNEVITQGDANNASDAPINKSQILGKYLFTSSVLTILLNNYYVFIGIIIVIFIINLFLDKKDNKVEENNKTEEKN